MIVYESGGVLGGWSNLARVHGSAAYKVVAPSLFSTIIMILYEYVSFRGSDERSLVVQHPYSIGAFISFFSFLLTFRLNFAYGRYWEGATAVHQMLSKWLDCAMCLGAFHYQSRQFAYLKPPTFGATDSSVTADRITGRERNFQGSTYDDTVGKIKFHDNLKPSLWTKMGRKRKSSSSLSDYTAAERHHGKSINSKHPGKSDVPRRHDLSAKIPIPTRFQGQFLKAEDDPGYCENDSSKERRKRWLVNQSRSTRNLTKSVRSKLPAPSLFLQETAHLLSLLSAVAMSTLRNDIDNVSSPIIPYVPGMEWPCYDPDSLSKEIQQAYGESHTIWRWINYCLGLSRSSKRRTLYNAARPFTVLGGCSDAEIRMLQKARGPYAKVALCSMWLQEFISREYLAGSTGNVAPPIVSRLYQFISDGTVGYNQARKIAYVPFPFPHGQVTSFFALAIIFIFPLLFSSFVNKALFACVMNFLTVLCFLGLHEVARELEQPFQNVPNDLPLLTFQAQLNEALVTYVCWKPACRYVAFHQHMDTHQSIIPTGRMYAGFHPDSWWEVAPDLAEVDEEDSSFSDNL